MATEDLMTRALDALGEDDPLSVEAIHRLTDLADVPDSIAATEYKIATYGGSTAPDVAALDTSTG
ncbi:hypothetical protein ACTMTJ_20955 [Phytohabitans sp. LJ34]|uniref:hypothetical protein n=1 Tax=Phytohabitans sp. LJ34 TaxID=3452217 RepID=UPI003F8A6063